MKVVVLKNNSPISESSWQDTEIDEGFEAYVGRSEDCHILIDDPLISRHHVVLRFEKNEWHLEKLSQLAPITVNGQVVQESLIVHQGDLVAFPPYAMLLERLPGGMPAVQVVAPMAPTMATSTFSQPTQTGMQDDLPPVESMEATVFIPPSPAATKTTAAPTMSEKTQELVEDILSDDLPVASDEKSAESVKDAGAELDSMNFSGEEDVIGSSPAPADETNTGAQEDTDFGGGDFSSEGTQADISGDSGESGSDDGTESTRVFQKFASYDLMLFGEFAPYDRFSIDRPEIFIGRDAKKCQIVLNDSEVSSVHAVLRKNMVSMTLEDLNSSNGTLLNGQRINKSELSNGDEFIIGSTTFTVQVSSDLLEAENDRLMPVEDGQTIEQIEEVEEEVPLDTTGGDGGIDFSGTEQVQEKSLIKRIMKDPKKKRIAMILGVLLLVVLLLEEEPAEKPKKVETKTETTKVDKPVDPKAPQKRKLSPEEIRSLEAKYKIAEAYVKDKKLDEALAELEQILAVDPDYANAKTLYTYVQEQNKKFKEEQERLKQEAARAKLREEVKGMLEEAKEAVAQRNVTRAEQLFSKILEKDPENMDVTPLKQELEAWQTAEREKAEAAARKKAERQRMVDALAPGKKLYLSKEWNKAIIKLEEFLTIKQMDEDLIKEGGDMLADAKAQLASEVAPLLGKARSLKEGQDLKGAYEVYLEITALDPTQKEALSEVDAIKDILETRSKKVYREAIIAESLSLFGDAKEKFQEVQQISPTDSEYYKKATEKLKNYLE